jgi:hypothetical protein
MNPFSVSMRLRPDKRVPRIIVFSLHLSGQRLHLDIAGLPWEISVDKTEYNTNSDGRHKTGAYDGKAEGFGGSTCADANACVLTFAQSVLALLRSSDQRPRLR